MLGITQSAALVGVDAHPVQVEVNTGEAGELKFILVGLPDAAVKESQWKVEQMQWHNCKGRRAPDLPN